MDGLACTLRYQFINTEFFDEDDFYDFTFDCPVDKYLIRYRVLCWSGSYWRTNYRLPSSDKRRQIAQLFEAVKRNDWNALCTDLVTGERWQHTSYNHTYLIRPTSLMLPRKNKLYGKTQHSAEFVYTLPLNGLQKEKR